MADSTRLRLTEERKKRFSRLERATGDSTRAGALDVAARYYTRTAAEHGPLKELMRKAIERGSLTPEEIAAILDTPS